MSNPTTLEAACVPTSFVCAILSNVTNLSTKEAVHWLMGPAWEIFITALGRLHSHCNRLPQFCFIPVHSNNCSIGHFLQCLWMPSIVVSPESRVQPQTCIQKSVQVILQTEPPAFLMLLRRHPRSHLPLIPR